ncbi:MAG: hypothetical protein NUV77_12370 [Thermoguttaceae bacterium]|jgi:hypothetical protein|nr:hypothetical protein [Thermoguttaceae bacterium]
MCPSASKALFPLPLNLFERYMLLDDRPDYPMTFALQARLAGQVRRAAFEAALEETVERHPLLHAVVDTGAKGGAVWVDAGSVGPALTWQGGNTPIDSTAATRIDLRREPGLRVWVRQDADSTEVVLSVHHACCDGIGLLQVLGDLLASYGLRTATGDAKPVLAPLDVGQLLARGRFTVEIPEGISRTRILWDTLKEAAKWIGRPPTPLGLSRSEKANEPTPPLSYPGILFHTFSEAETRRMRAAARKRNATLNDLLLRDLFVTCSEWNQTEHPSRPGRWLRINMPQNLRERQHDRMPAANAMSQAFLTRRAADCTDPKALLEGLRRETEAIRRWRLGLYFLGGLSIAERIPGALRLGMALLGRRCHATTVLTNIGEFTRRFTARLPRRGGRIVAGDLILERLVGMPPLRPKTYAGFGAGTYAGELTVTVRGDFHRFRADRLERLLRLYVARLSANIGVADRGG